jgi:hypothetical protein
MRVHGAGGWELAGVEASRVNPFMSADLPSYEPYKVFAYSANLMPMMMALMTALNSLTTLR